jgi:membrane protein involved in colicin uptake
MTTAIEINCTTGEVSERELTAAELAQREADTKAYADQKAADDKAAADKEAKRLAVYAKLGLTADEIAALA